MHVSMLEANNRLSRLVKAAQAGEEVIIANHGVPAVRLVPTREPRRTGGLGSLKLDLAVLDAAFAPKVKATVTADLLGEG